MNDSHQEMSSPFRAVERAAGGSHAVWFALASNGATLVAPIAFWHAISPTSFWRNVAEAMVANLAIVVGSVASTVLFSSQPPSVKSYAAGLVGLMLAALAVAYMLGVQTQFATMIAFSFPVVIVVSALNGAVMLRLFGLELRESGNGLPSAAASPWQCSMRTMIGAMVYASFLGLFLADLLGNGLIIRLVRDTLFPSSNFDGIFFVSSMAIAAVASLSVAVALRSTRMGLIFGGIGVALMVPMLLDPTSQDLWRGVPFGIGQSLLVIAVITVPWTAAGVTSSWGKPPLER